MSSYTLIFKNRFFRFVSVLLLSLFIFFIADKIIYSLISQFAKNWYSTKFSSTLKKNLERSERADIIIMGTSRTRYGINPILLSNILRSNVRMEAGAGRNIRYQYHFYKLYRKYFTSPKIVIYGCDYFMFNAKSRSDELTAAGAISGEESFESTFAFKQDKEDMNLLQKISLLYRMKPVLDNFFVNYVNSLNTFSENAGLGSWAIEKRSLFGGRRIRKGLTFPYVRSPGIEGKFLTMLLELLDRDHVKVIFTILPDYIGTYKSQRGKKIYVRDIKNISLKYQNSSIIDFNNPKKFDLSNPKNFFNGGAGKISSHLNFFGANTLTMKLGRSINKISEIRSDQYFQ